MKSRITIEVDFENGNRPVLQIHERESEDVRDRLVQSLTESLGHQSRWFTAEFKLNSMTDGEVGHIWHLAPVKPKEIWQEIQLMQAYLDSLPASATSENNDYVTVK